MKLYKVLGLFENGVDVTIVSGDETLFSGRKGDVYSRPIEWLYEHGANAVKLVRAIWRDEIWIYIEEEN